MPHPMSEGLRRILQTMNCSGLTLAQQTSLGDAADELDRLHEVEQRAVPAGMTVLVWTESHGPRQYECSILRRTHSHPTGTTDWYVYLWSELLDRGLVGSAIEALDAAREAIAAAEAAQEDSDG